MKRSAVLAVTLLTVFSFASSSLAAVMIPTGVRSAGMGGCGIAISKGIDAVPYNPAGLMNGGYFEVRAGAGVTEKEMDKLGILQQAAGGISDDLLNDLYKDDLDINFAGNGLVGIGIAKIALTVNSLNWGTANKAKNSIDSNSILYSHTTNALTLGQTFQAPFLPLATINIGGSLKSLISYINSIDIAGTSGTDTSAIGFGTGLDLGLLAELNVPALTKLSVGLVVRDAFESITYQSKADSYSVTGVYPSIVITPVAEAEDRSLVRVPTTYGLGVAGTLPGFGTLLTADMVDVCGKEIYTEENGDVTGHFGIEQPILMGLVNLRCGWATGRDPYSTIGFGIGLGVNSIDLAYVTDGKDSKGNALGAEISIGI